MKLHTAVELFYRYSNWRHFTLQLRPLIKYYRDTKLEATRKKGKRSFTPLPLNLNRFLLFQCLQMLYGSFFIGRLFFLAYLLEKSVPIEELIADVDPFFAVLISKSTFLRYPHSVSSCAVLSIFVVYIGYVVAFGTPLETGNLFYSLVNLNAERFFRLNRPIQKHLRSLQFSSISELKDALVETVQALWLKEEGEEKTTADRKRNKQLRFALQQLPGFPRFSAALRLKLLTLTWAVEVLGVLLNLVADYVITLILSAYYFLLLWPYLTNFTAFSHLTFDLLALLFHAFTFTRLAVLTLQLFTLLAFPVFCHMRALVRSLKQNLTKIETVHKSFPLQNNVHHRCNRLHHLLVVSFTDHLILLKTATLLDQSSVGPCSLIAFITQTLTNMLIVAQLFLSSSSASAEAFVLYETALLVLFLLAQVGLALASFTTLIVISSALQAPKEALFKAQTLLFQKDRKNSQRFPALLEVKLKLLTRLEIVSHREAFAFHIGKAGVFTRAFLAKLFFYYTSYLMYIYQLLKR